MEPRVQDDERPGALLREEFDQRDVHFRRSIPSRDFAEALQRSGMVSPQVESDGLRRTQSIVLLRRIALTRSGSSVSARTRGNKASAVRKTSRRTLLSPRASSTSFGASMRFVASRSNFSSGFS